MTVSQFIREYGGVIWTDHALERLKKRKIAQSDALAVLKNPDRTFPGKKEASVKFIRTIQGRPIHAVASLNEKKQWVVLSVWVRGEEDQKPLVWRFLGWIWKKMVS